MTDTRLSPELTAYRPIYPDQDIYFEIDKTVLDAHEEHPVLGPGIRINNSNRNESGENEGENDLIRVDLKIQPNQTVELIRNTGNLKVYLDREAKYEIQFTNNTSELILGLINENDVPKVRELWVEYKGEADFYPELAVIEQGGESIADKLIFHPFQNMVVLITGENQEPRLINDETPDHNSQDGVFSGLERLAVSLINAGYDVHLVEEPDGESLWADLFDVNWPGSQSDQHGQVEEDLTPLLIEVSDSYYLNSLSDLALIGYSHGGGSVFDLSVRVQEVMNDGLNLTLTSYVDAVQNPAGANVIANNNVLSGMAPESRLPINTLSHLNYFQESGALHGQAIQGADINFFCTDEEHSTIHQNTHVLVSIFENLISSMPIADNYTVYSNPVTDDWLVGFQENNDSSGDNQQNQGDSTNQNTQDENIPEQSTPKGLGAFANVNTSEVGQITRRGESVIYEMHFSEGQKVSFIVFDDSSKGGTFDPFLSVTYPDGITTQTNDDIAQGIRSSFYSLVVPQTGTYQIKIHGVGSSVGSFTLLISPDNSNVASDGSGDVSDDTRDEDDINWHWEGSDEDDRPSVLTLQSGGAPSVNSNNNYRGHDGEDRIEAGAGNDVVWGDDDDDRLYGEDGNDTLRGGDDEDRLVGGNGDDLIYGDDGDDRINGDINSANGLGDDTIYGGKGKDDIRAGAGNDFVDGGDDEDEINGNAGNDHLLGGDDDDEIEGGDGNDHLEGQHGEDRLEGDAGDDWLYGGSHKDFLQGGEGNDYLDGGDNKDTADFSDGDAGVLVDLINEKATSPDLGVDILENIENINGSDGDDVIIGDNEKNILNGLDGNDIINGDDRDDFIYGGDENDTLLGDDGDDQLFGEDDHDILKGGSGNDLLDGGDNDDELYGGLGNDNLVGGSGIDTAYYGGDLHEFSIRALAQEGIEVSDNRPLGEGVDTISQVEYLQFEDKLVFVEDVFNSEPVATNDVASTNKQNIVSIDVAANDQINASDYWVLSVKIADGFGNAYIAGKSVIYDPSGDYDYLSPGESEKVKLNYIIDTSSGKSISAEIEVLVNGLTNEEQEVEEDVIVPNLPPSSGSNVISVKAGVGVYDPTIPGAAGALVIEGDPNDPLLFEVSLNGATPEEGAKLVLEFTDDSAEFGQDTSAAILLDFGDGNGFVASTVSPQQSNGTTTFTIDLPAQVEKLSVALPTINDGLLEAAESLLFSAYIEGTEKLSGVTGTILDSNRANLNYVESVAVGVGAFDPNLLGGSIGTSVTEGAEHNQLLFQVNLHEFTSSDGQYVTLSFVDETAQFGIDTANSVLLDLGDGNGFVNSTATFITANGVSSAQVYVAEGIDSFTVALEVIDDAIQEDAEQISFTAKTTNNDTFNESVNTVTAYILDNGDTEVSTDAPQENQANTNLPSFSAIENGIQVNVTPEVYTGTVDFLEYQFLGDLNGNVVNGADTNDFINLLAGDDAADGKGGRDVLDGGIGSNFLTGGEGEDTFFIDGRSGVTTWSTITDFTSGDTVNIWGWVEGTSQLLLTEDSAGAEGFKGATFHYDLDNNGQIDTSITFSGLTSAQAPTSSAQIVGDNGYLLFA